MGLSVHLNSGLGLKLTQEKEGKFHFAKSTWKKKRLFCLFIIIIPWFSCKMSLYFFLSLSFSFISINFWNFIFVFCTTPTNQKKNAQSNVFFLSLRYHGKNRLHYIHTHTHIIHTIFLGFYYFFLSWFFVVIVVFDVCTCFVKKISFFLYSQ